MSPRVPVALFLKRSDIQFSLERSYHLSPRVPVALFLKRSDIQFSLERSYPKTIFFEF